MTATARRSWGSLAFALLLLSILILGQDLSTNFAQDFRAAALSWDPTLAAAPWETVWGIFSAPIRFVVFASFSHTGQAETNAVFLMSILLTISMRNLRGGGSEGRLLAQTLFFGVSVYALSGCFDTNSFCSGPDILLFALLTLPYILTSPSEDPADPRYFGPMNRVALLSSAFASGMSVVYLLILAPALRRATIPLSLRSWKYFLAPVFLPGLAFAIQRIRYPNPDLPPLENIWTELANSWLYGKTILDGAFGVETGPRLFAFPGLLLGLAWLLSLGFVRLCSFSWRTGAGRTVPAQVLLYLLPVFYALALYGGYRLGNPEEETEQPPSLEERLNHARALHETLPPNTVLYASRDLYDAIVYLHAAEGVQNRIDLEPGEGPFWTEESFQADTVRSPFSRTPVAYSEGTNWVGIVGEPIEFAPQHLLGATEVYMATPTYFLGASPAPELSWKEKPFDPGDLADFRLNDWSFDGQHLYLFRDHVDPVWRPLGRSWEIGYFGFLLKKDLDRWNRPLSPQPRQEIEAFYK